jgi:hypothetical protein
VSRSETIKLLVPLLAAVYLGFYVFGLVMGVFGPGEIAWLSIVAAVCALGLVVYWLARRRGIDPIPASSPAARTARSAREKRGW